MLLSGPHGQNLEAVMLPAAAEILRFRDETVPTLASEGRFDAIQELTDQYWSTLLTSTVAYCDKLLRNELVIVLLWAGHVAQQRKPIQQKYGPADIARCVDDPLTHTDTSDWMIEWLLTPGSQLYPDHVQLVVGRTIAGRAKACIEDYAIRVYAPEDTADTARQVALFFDRAAALNSYERTNDTFLFEELRSYLSSARQAMLGFAEGPMKILPEQYDDPTGNLLNGLVRPLVEKNAAETLCGVAWKTVLTPTVFILLSVLIREQCDGLPLHVLSNANIPVHASSLLESMPQLFVLTDPDIRSDTPQFGVVFENVLHVINPQTEYAMLHTFLLWIRKAIAAGEHTSKNRQATTSLRQLFICLVDPDAIELSNPFAKLFRG